MTLVELHSKTKSELIALVRELYQHLEEADKLNEQLLEVIDKQNKNILDAGEALTEAERLLGLRRACAKITSSFNLMGLRCNLSFLKFCCA